MAAQHSNSTAGASVVTPNQPVQLANQTPQSIAGRQQQQARGPSKRTGSHTKHKEGFLTDSNGSVFKMAQLQNSQQSKEFLEQVKSHSDYMRKVSTISEKQPHTSPAKAAPADAPPLLTKKFPKIKHDPGFELTAQAPSLETHVQKIMKLVQQSEPTGPKMAPPKRKFDMGTFHSMSAGKQPAHHGSAIYAASASHAPTQLYTNNSKHPPGKLNHVAFAKSTHPTRFMPPP